MRALRPSNSTAKYIPMRNLHTHQKTCAIAQNWKLSKCPSTEEKNEMCIHKVEYQAAIRMNDLVTWVCSVYKM